MDLKLKYNFIRVIYENVLIMLQNHLKLEWNLASGNFFCNSLMYGSFNVSQTNLTGKLFSLVDLHKI